MTIFTSRHTIWLEAEIEKQREYYKQILIETKKIYEEQLGHVITQYEKLHDEYQRLVRVMHPSVQSVELPGERATVAEPKEVEPVFGGSRWQQFLAKEVYKQERAARLQQEAENGSV